MTTDIEPTTVKGVRQVGRISVERSHPSGALILSTMVRGDSTQYLLRRRYIMYTSKEALTMFRVEVQRNGGYAR